MKTEKPEHNLACDVVILLVDCIVQKGAHSCFMGNMLNFIDFVIIRT